MKENTYSSQVNLFENKSAAPLRDILLLIDGRDFGIMLHVTCTKYCKGVMCNLIYILDCCECAVISVAEHLGQYIVPLTCKMRAKAYFRMNNFSVADKP